MSPLPASLPAPLSVICEHLRRPDVTPRTPPHVGNLKAFATLIFDEQLAVHGVRLVGNAAWPAPKIFFPCHSSWIHCPRCDHQAEERDNYCRHCGEALTPAHPSDRRWFDVAHPLNHVLRDACLAAVTAAHDRAVSEGLQEVRFSRPAPPAEAFRDGV